MGFLDKSTVTVDAILTKKGRERLASGNFNIVSFAVADDDIDYTLYDINHAKGTNFYGQAIENMPLTEAVPDGGKMMRFKLMTLPKNIQKIPYATTTPAGATITVPGGAGNIGSIGITLSNAQQAGAFTATISDPSIAYFVVNGVTSANFQTGNVAQGGSVTISFFGQSLLQEKSTTITVVHEGTGLTVQKTITVEKDPAFIDT